jgi:5-methylcytosine-specific restriction endonuclease McrA
MSTYRLTEVGDDALLRGLATLVAQDRTTTANLLAHMAEVDARRLYAPAGYSSMHAYCVEKLRLSDDAAWKRLQVARKVRQFPQICAALAEGRVHLTGLNLLVPHLTADNVDDLLRAATHLRKSEIELLLARRFPQVEVLRLDEGISALPRLAPAQVNAAPTAVAPTPAPVEVRQRIAPITAQRFNLQVTIESATRDKLRYAQDLLGQGDVAAVLDRALDALIGQLEKRKFATTDKPRRPRKATRARTIPAHVRRSVREDEKPRCAFVGDDGQRCTATRFLEFDHVIPVALGGEATVGQVRLLCRTHNQLEAERVLGREFMEEKRNDTTTQVISALRALGMNADEAKRAAALSAPTAALEARIRIGLQSIRLRGTKMAGPSHAGSSVVLDAPVCGYLACYGLDLRRRKSEWIGI